MFRNFSNSLACNLTRVKSYLTVCEVTWSLDALPYKDLTFLKNFRYLCEVIFFIYYNVHHLNEFIGN